MRKIIFASMWVICFMYSILLFIYGNTGLLQYQKAYESYKKIEQNINNLKLIAFENDAKLEFWKNTLAGNLVHELGYLEQNEVALFPVVKTPVLMQPVQFESFQKNTIANINFLQKSMVCGLLTFIVGFCAMLLTRKNHRSF